MRLPGANRAIIESAKIRDYLLNPDHPVGFSKAEFFLSMGFRAAEWALLAAAIRRQILISDAVPAPGAVHGRKFTVTGPLAGPYGFSRSVTTVWIIAVGTDAPRLITAYAGERA